MKKRFFIVYVMIALLAFLACGRIEEVKEEVKSEDVIAVENAIDAIGSVTITSIDKIEEAERLYSLLSIEDQEKVSNYNLLLTARSEYNRIPKPVELFTSNIKTYLELSLDFSKPEIHPMGQGIGIAKSNAILKIYPIKGGTFENVEITLEVPLTLWNVATTDKAYNEADTSTITYKIKLPANGTYEETHEITSITSGASAFDPYLGSRIVLKSVKGTFIPNN